MSKPYDLLRRPAGVRVAIETPTLPLLRTVDAVMLAKYVTRMTAAATAMTANFVPKPLYGEAGSGMHFHQQLWGGSTNLFYDAAG